MAEQGNARSSAVVLRRYVEHAFTAGLTISQIMDRYLVTYEYAYGIKHGMEIHTRRNLSTAARTG